MDIEVEYEYLNQYEDGTTFPLYDIMTEDYLAFLHYDKELLQRMFQALKKIRIIYRIQVRPSNASYSTLLECHQWVLLAHCRASLKTSSWSQELTRTSHWTASKKNAQAMLVLGLVMCRCHVVKTPLDPSGDSDNKRGHLRNVPVQHLQRPDSL